MQGGGRAVIHFETTTAKSIQRYTTDWLELEFDVFPVVAREGLGGLRLQVTPQMDPWRPVKPPWEAYAAAFPCTSRSEATSMSC